MKIKVCAVFERDFDNSKDIEIEIDDLATVESLAHLIIKALDVDLSNLASDEQFTIRVNRESYAITLLPDTSVKKSYIQNGDDLQIIKYQKTDLEINNTGEYANILQNQRNIIRQRPPFINITERHFDTKVNDDTEDDNIFPIWTVLIPIILGIVVYFFMPSPLSLLFILMTPLMIVANWISNKHNTKQKHKKRLLLTEMQNQKHLEKISKLLEEEANAIESNYPDLDTVNLWSKFIETSHFLKIPIGKGEINSHIFLDNSVQKLNSKVIFNLKDSIGICEREPSKDIETTDTHFNDINKTSDHNSIFMYLISYISKVYSPHELKFVLFGEKTLANYDCFKWANNCIISNPKTEYDLTKLLSKDYHLIIISSHLSIEEHKTLSAFISLVTTNPANNYSYSFIIRDSDLKKIPHYCQYLYNNNSLLNCADNSNIAFDPYTSNISNTTKLLKSLSHYCDISSTHNNISSKIPNQVNVADIYSIKETVAQSYITLPLSPLKVPIGICSGLKDATNGKYLTESIEYLDLIKDGPHALVGGTTGSGKSEFLQSWIISLALAHSPKHLNFLLFDYKGGSAFSKCSSLPHTVGLVTDLDELLLERVLESLAAEIKYRERHLQHLDLQNISQTHKLDSDQSLPYLVIVVDEFAAIVNDLPQFTDRIVDLAARGRSLGIHLIMATQRPSGVISNNLRANTNMRIALRVSDSSDSIDILETDLAAKIPNNMPGRGYMRDANTCAKEFQSIYLNQPHKAKTDGGTVRDFNLKSQRTLVQEATLSKETSLDYCITEINNAFKNSKSKLPRKVFLDPLPDSIDIDDISAIDDLKFGICDKTSEQKQIPLTLNKNNYLVIGAPTSGKTNTLITFATTLRNNYPDDAIYFIKYNSESKSTVLNKVCSQMFDFNNTDALIRLFTKIMQCKLSQKVFLIIDGLDLLKEELEQKNSYDLLSALNQIISNSNAFKTQIFASSSRPNALTSNITGYFESQIILRLANDLDYSFFNLKPGDFGQKPPLSRAIINKSLTQIYYIDSDKIKLPKYKKHANLQIEYFTGDYQYNGKFWAVNYNDLSKLCNYNQPQTLLIYKDISDAKKVIKTLSKEIKGVELFNISNDEDLAKWEGTKSNTKSIVAVEYSVYCANWNISNALKEIDSKIIINVQNEEMFTITAATVDKLPTELNDSSTISYYINSQSNKAQVISIAQC